MDSNSDSDSIPDFRMAIKKCMKRANKCTKLLAIRIATFSPMRLAMFVRLYGACLQFIASSNGATTNPNDFP